MSGRLELRKKKKGRGKTGENHDRKVHLSPSREVKAFDQGVYRSSSVLYFGRDGGMML